MAMKTNVDARSAIAPASGARRATTSKWIGRPATATGYHARIRPRIERRLLRGPSGWDEQQTPCEHRTRPEETLPDRLDGRRAGSVKSARPALLRSGRPRVDDSRAEEGRED